MTLATLEGDALAFDYPEEGVKISFSRIQEGREGLTGEITIKRLDKFLHWGNLNLSSAQTRDRLASSLSKKSQALDWDIVIAQTCHAVVTEFRKPTPLVNLAQVEPEMFPGYLVKPLLPKGETTLLFADGASGKSMLALWLATALTWKIELPSGLYVPEKGKVLYLDWETHHEVVARRLNRISQGFKIKAPDILYREMLAPLADQVAAIKADCKNAGISLVILDSLGAACGGDLNEASTAIRTMNALREISATKLVVHHITHEGANSNGRAHPFGSRYFRNLARSAWEVRRGEDDEEGDVIPLALFHTKVNEGRLWRSPIGLSLEFTGEDGAVTVSKYDLEDDPTLSKRLSLSHRITRTLRDGKKDVKQLSEELDVTESTIRKTLGRMKNVTRHQDITPQVWGLQESPA